MGLFSGETIYTVETSTNRVIEDDRIDSPLLSALVQAVLGDSSISEELVNSFSKTVSYRADKMHRYIDEHYPQGVLTGRLNRSTGHNTQIKQAIQDDTGHGNITLEYAELTTLNYHHAAWEHLVSAFGYDPDTNELTALSTTQGGPTYLDSFLIRMPNDVFAIAEGAGTDRTFGRSQDSGYTPERTATALAEYVTAPVTASGEVRNDILVEVAYVTQGDDGLTRGLDTFVLSQPTSEEEFVQARYQYAGKTYFWSYQQGSGGHASLDDLKGLGTPIPGKYLPVINFRRNFTNLSHSSRADSSEYKAAEEALDILGMDYASVGESIHENGDIDKVRNAYMMFGAPGNSSDPLVVRYLWSFYSNILNRAYEDGTDLERVNSQTGYFGLYLTTPQDLGDHQIGAYMFAYIYKMSRRFKGGKLGPVGSFHRTTSTATHTVVYSTLVRTGDNGETTRETRTKEVSHPVLVLRYQTTQSSYEELFIEAPQLRHKIDGSGRHTRNGVGDKDFLVPLDYTLIEGWSARDRSALYQKSLHFIFNARDKQEVEWYETGFFRFVLTVIAIVITIYTGIPAWQAMAATLATATIGAILWAVVVAVVKIAAFQYGAKLVAKEFGEEFALVAAVVLAMYGSYKGFQAGSMANAPWATEMIQVANNLSRAAQSAYQEGMEALADEYDDLLGLEEEREAELERARDLLNSGSTLLKPVDLIWGESPEDYYARTVHSGNVGRVGFDAIHSYVDLSLTLPEISDTLPGTPSSLFM